VKSRVKRDINLSN
jgi:hypothetical protein